MIDSLAFFVQVAVAAREVQALEPLVVKLGLTLLTVISAAAVALVKLTFSLSRKWDTFAVTWYGDPSDREPNGAKATLYTMAGEVTALKDWTRGYDRALGALAKDNANLRAEWQPGDPERRTHPRTPRL